MTPTHLARMDLNLLLQLHALLEEQNVTRAAKRLGLTQSAASRALARLREHFDDPLLVRSGSGMVTTPRARDLADGLGRALGELDALVGRTPSFDPMRAPRTFRVATVDYVVAVLLRRLLERLAREASAATLSILPMPAEPDAALESGAIDLVIGPRRRSPAGTVWTQLFSDRFVTIARRDHPSIGRALSLDRFCELTHVFVAPDGRAGPSAIDDVLAREGRRRTIALRLPSFLAVPLAVAHSDAIATVPERLAATFAEPLALRVLDPPLQLSRVGIALAWHERVRRDPGHAWFRRFVASTAREV